MEPIKNKDNNNELLAPDSFALMLNKYIVVQFKSLKQIKIYKLDSEQIGNAATDLHMTIESAISRNGKSFCIYDKFLAFRNLKQKCFEIIDVESRSSKVSHAYEDIWYYNNYHVLGTVFVFPHYMKVTFFNATDNF